MDANCWYAFEDEKVCGPRGYFAGMLVKADISRSYIPNNAKAPLSQSE